MRQSLVELPRRALIALLRGYRLLLSPWLGSACRCTPSCSVYTIEALERHGALGGSSLGAKKAGLVGRMAANHWRMAIDSHQSNFPDMDHDCADISQVRPERYPATDILLASPEGTNHSLAKGVRRKQLAQDDLVGC